MLCHQTSNGFRLLGAPLRYQSPKTAFYCRFLATRMTKILQIYRIYSRIGRNFFLIFFNKKHGCDLSARHTLKVFGCCKYRIFRLISRYRHELRLRLCSHIPMRDSFMRAHAHATAQRALDFPALLRKNGFAILMFDFEVICFNLF